MKKKKKMKCEVRRYLPLGDSHKLHRKTWELKSESYVVVAIWVLIGLGEKRTVEMSAHGGWEHPTAEGGP